MGFQGLHFEVFLKPRQLLAAFGSMGGRRDPTWSDFMTIWVSFWSPVGSPIPSLWAHFREIVDNVGYLAGVRVLKRFLDSIFAES